MNDKGILNISKAELDRMIDSEARKMAAEIVRKNNPTPSDVHVNAPLTNISVAYMQDQTKFIAGKVFPMVPVQKQSDRYYVYTRADFNRDEMKVRAPATESRGGGYRLDNTPTYFCDIRAFHRDIDDVTRSNADSVLNLEREASLYLTLKYLINLEVNWASSFFAASVWGTDKTGGSDFTKWSDSASTPIEDVEEWKATILEDTGFEPNSLVLGRWVFNALKNHPDILDRIKYTGGQTNPAKGTLQLLAQLFELDNVYVMNAIRNTAAEGATESSSFIGSGTSALLVHAASSPGLMTPTGGYTFVWSNYLGAGAQGQRISSFRMEHLKSDRYEIEAAYDQVVVGSDLGMFLSSAADQSAGGMGV